MNPLPKHDSHSPKRRPSGAIDLTKVLGGYEGRWVALRSDLSEVVASGNDFAECNQAVIRKEGNTDSVGFMRVPPLGVKLLYALELNRK